MEDLRDINLQPFDNSENLPNGIKMMENDILLNTDYDVEKQLEEFVIILNNRRSSLTLNENELNLDEINDIVSEQLLQNDATTDNIAREDSLTNNTLNAIDWSVPDEDIDIISISSTDSQNSGYHSSDFEFITENEAKRDSLILNFQANISKQHLDDPGEGTSGMNTRAKPRIRHIPPSKILNEYINRSSNTLKYKRPPVNYGDRLYRNNHGIPEGDNYLNLFQGIYDPRIQEIHFLENKSIKTSVMSVGCDEIGFDMQLFAQPHVPENSDDEFEDEAKENAKRIRSLYPYENKRRRRH